jgi:hypothetical protein
MKVPAPLRRRVSPDLKERLYKLFRSVTNVHRPGEQPSVILFTMPRSGSTWLMELIWSQPGFKSVNEPFDLRNPLVRKHLQISSWEELQSASARPKIERYLRGYLTNRIHAAETAPQLNKYYRPLTNRIVFKIIHAGEDKINWFRDALGVKIAFSIRHPIPVSLSHKVFPRLTSYLQSDYRERFTAAQLALADKIIRQGTKLEHGVLDWCFQNALPLQDRQDDWAVLSYEQLVLDPKPSLDYLAEKLSLPDKARMLEHLDRASGVKRKSDAETQRLLEQRDNQQKRLRLVSKWRDRVSDDEERRAFDILEAFEIDAYRYGQLLPSRALWVGNDYDVHERALARVQAHAQSDPQPAADAARG